MALEDASLLLLSSRYRPLLMSSRPGYLFRTTGRRACEMFASAMRQRRVGLAVVLLTADEMEAFYGIDLCPFYAARGIESLHFPVPDGSIPDDRSSFHNLVKTIRRRLGEETVLVHCNAGLGRTGTVAAGLLVYEGARGDAAIARVREVRKGALENRWQEDFIREYDEAMHGRRTLPSAWETRGDDRRPGPRG